ncbi:MAG: nucleotidyl transferase AbiEii/AbiGii toxin family protein [Kofleriaceae bacterium]
MRRHVMLGVVGRLARTPARATFVLRGGLLTSLWIDPVPRPTRDLDFVGDFAFDLEATRAAFAPTLITPLDDDIVLDPASLRASGLWLDTPFPGVRLELRCGLGAVDQDLSIDVGFCDPLVPPTVEREVRGATIRAIRPELQLAWKLHALAEMTASWRPKDLADVALILRHVQIVDADLVAAIVAAFESRGFSRTRAVELFDAAYWPTKTSRLRWEPRQPSLAETLAEVHARLAPILASLPSW